MSDVRFRLGRGASGRFKWVGLVRLVSVWVVWAASQKRHLSAALDIDRDARGELARTL
jgi:hypothetical protein